MNKRLRARNLELDDAISRLKKALEDMKSQFNDVVYFDLMTKASSVPANLIDAYANKVKISSSGKSNTTQPGRAYSDEVRKFALTLFAYSKKSYLYVRESLDNCLPSERTIFTWMERVDGSPGFNSQALNHMKNLVEQKAQFGKKV